MEELQQLLEDVGRFFLLQGRLPQREQAREQTRREALAGERLLKEKRLEWERLKEPGLLLRLSGRAEQKQDAAFREYREAEAARNQANRAAEEARQVHEQEKAELDTLQGVRERYLQIRETETVPELAEMAARAFRPAAVDTAERCLAALEASQTWARNEACHLTGPHDSHMLGYFAEAEKAALSLRWLLAQFPEPETWSSAYLEGTNTFLLYQAMEFSRLDRLNEAIGQVRQILKRLKRE